MAQRQAPSGAKKATPAKAASLAKATNASNTAKAADATDPAKTAKATKAADTPKPAPAAKTTAAAKVAEAAPPAKAVVRRTSTRHLHRTSRGDRTSVDPSKIVKVPAAHALPGENEPLRYRPGRGPVTEAEALGVRRRRERARLKERLGFVDESQVSSALPSWSDPKPMASHRMSVPLKALSEALAEIEEVSWADYMELLVWEQSKLPPRDPDEVRQALRSMHRETIGMEDLNQEYGA